MLNFAINRLALEQNWHRDEAPTVEGLTVEGLVLSLVEGLVLSLVEGLVNYCPICFLGVQSQDSLDV